MCYDLFIFMTEREQLIWKTTEGKEKEEKKNTHPVLCRSVLKAAPCCYGS
jgi:hypothetical protein